MNPMGARRSRREGGIRGARRPAETSPVGPDPRGRVPSSLLPLAGRTARAADLTAPVERHSRRLVVEARGA
jgi:hypothetical protein